LAVPIQDLKPDVLMIEPAKDWYRRDTADLLGPAKIRSIFIQQFAVCPGLAPKRVILAHPSDEVADLAVNSGAATAPAGFPAPVSAKAAPMPADHVSGLTTVIASRI
jgi:hypothetical protein